MAGAARWRLHVGCLLRSRSFLGTYSLTRCYRRGSLSRLENKMTPVVADTDQSEVSTFAWAPVIAGAVVAAALTLLLAALGVGLGLSVVSPWSGEGVSTTTFHVGAGLY